MLFNKAVGTPENSILTWWFFPCASASTRGGIHTVFRLVHYLTAWRISCSYAAVSVYLSVCLSARRTYIQSRHHTVWFVFVFVWVGSLHCMSQNNQNNLQTFVVKCTWKCRRLRTVMFLDGSENNYKTSCDDCRSVGRMMSVVAFGVRGAVLSESAVRVVIC